MMPWTHFQCARWLGVISTMAKLVGLLPICFTILGCSSVQFVESADKLKGCSHLANDKVIANNSSSAKRKLRTLAKKHQSDVVLIDESQDIEDIAIITGGGYGVSEAYWFFEGRFYDCKNGL